MAYGFDDQEDFIAQVAENLFFILKDKNFTYGNDLQDIDTEDLQKALENSEQRINR